MTTVFRQVISNGDRGPQNTVRFCITATFIATRFEIPAHLVGHLVDNCIKAFFFIRGNGFFGQLQTFVFALPVD